MKTLYADVIIDISHENVDRTFSYRVPAALEDKISTGTEVRIPFGNGDRLRKGYVVSLSENSSFDGKTIKEIYSIEENRENIEARQMKLAFWMHEHYGGTIFRSLRTVLPVKNKVRPKLKRQITRIIDIKDAQELLKQYEKKHALAKAKIINELIEKENCNLDDLMKRLKVSMPSVQGIVKDRAAVIEETGINRITLPKDFVSGKEIRLNAEQRQTADEIWNCYKKGILNPSLIYGITGSGKTEVYIELISKVLEEGKQAIVLIPEISLTYQTVSRFVNRFGNRVSMLNSKMSDGERFDQFERAKSGEIRVMIGPRSALFTPFQNLGLIVIDEEHESTYKNENQPRYHARDVAEKLCEMSKAMLVLGSATPSLESYSAAESGRYRLYRLLKRGNDAKRPEVLIVDMRKELESGNRSIFSGMLQKELQETLSKKEQAMLFINRRGYSGFISCRSCGKPIRCPHCDVSLTLHLDNSLRCHYCGYHLKMINNCPACGSKYIGAFKAGTQQIARQLEKALPGARVLRMDYDTTRNKGDYEKILKAFARQEADIMVGTQMIVKGHDFPKVTLMGILAADSSLFVSDFRAAERSFQLLTQAAGRVGRAEKKGRVVIQTYQPEHYAVEYAAAQDFESFYREEMQYRRLLGYPPVSHVLVIMTASKDQNDVKVLAEYIKEKTLGMADDATVILGPSAAGIEKLKDYYRQMIYIRNGSKKALEELRDHIDRIVKQSDQAANCLVQYDIDPVQMQ